MYEIIKLIDEALFLCQQELENLKKGISSEVTKEQIVDTIIPDLLSTKEKIINDDLPEKEKRYLLSYVYAFKVWSWNIRKPSKLYDVLLDIHLLLKKI